MYKRQENGLIKDEGTPKFIGEAYLAAMEGRRLDRIEFENQQKKEELERKIKEEQERLRIEQEKEEKKRQEEEKRQKEEEKRKEAERQKAVSYTHLQRKNNCTYDRVCLSTDI